MADVTAALVDVLVERLGPLAPNDVLVLRDKHLNASDLALMYETLRARGWDGLVICLPPGRSLEVLDEPAARRLYATLKRRFEPEGG